MIKWQRSKFHPNLSLCKNGKRVTGCKAFRELSKKAAKEGIVLLKNNDYTLPLKKGKKVALFGKGSIDYVKGGGGSGDVNVDYIVNLYEGMKQLKEHVTVFEELSEYYIRYVNNEYSNGNAPGMIAEPKLPGELIEKARAFTDTSIISISRFSGEGWDRRSTFDKESDYTYEGDRILAQTAKKLFEKGDFYLSKAEEYLVNKVKSIFAKVIVVLNVGGVIDTQWFVKENSIQSVLLAWQGGMEGGRAVAELLCGFGNFSGKLADTFAKELEDYPSTPTFHESDEYVDYIEDIYVGYRYFETIPHAKEKVNYPFGFGLSYTQFEWSITKSFKQEQDIFIYANVLNIGEVSGKEVIQVYACPPQGELGKPYKNLVAFKKTRLLRSGESQIVILRFSVNSLASYDDLGKIEKSAYVLEAGQYSFFVGTSVWNTVKIDYSYEQEDNFVLEKLSEKIAPVSLKERMLSDGGFEKLPLKETRDTDASVLNRFPKNVVDESAPLAVCKERQKLFRKSVEKDPIDLLDVVEGKMTLDDFIEKLSNEDLVHLLGGQPNMGVANTFGIGNIPEYGVPNIMTADGPAGLRLHKECGVTTTAWPCSTLLACTWDEEIVYAVGEAGAKEVKENNIGVWLTPAINIRRSPLCGRNFEYYSEDPYLTGKLATAMVKGIQSQNIGAVVKHFALNNKETNRRNSDSRVSERAAREIYLKAFEIIVKEAEPWCIMSSYNIINGYRASENCELLEDILRNEWGFNGVVTTDWWTFAEHYKEIKAGNDLKMGCGYPERVLMAIEKGALTRADLKVCARRILDFIMKLD